MNTTSTANHERLKLTNRQTIVAIRALGLTVKWSAEWSEWIVNYRTDDKRRTAESSYHTNDRQDAIDTAYQMSLHKG